MKITVDGYFNQNVGDDLFFTLLANRYPGHQFYAWSWYTLETQHHNLFSRYSRLTNKLLSREQIEKRRFSDTDLLVEIGGSIFMEGISKNQNWSKADKPFYILGANFGPFQSEGYQSFHTDLFFRAEDVCFRDRYSKSLFPLETVRQQADIAFLLGKDQRLQKLAENKKKQLFVSLMHFDDEKINQAYLTFIQKQIDLFKEQEYEILLCAFHPLQKDDQDFKALHGTDRTLRYNGTNLNQILDEIAQSRAVLASRFHAIVLGLALKAEVLPISYNPKSKELLKDLGVEAGLSLEDLAAFSDSQLDPFWISLSDVKIKELADSAEKQFQLLDQALGNNEKSSLPERRLGP